MFNGCKSDLGIVCPEILDINVQQLLNNGVAASYTVERWQRSGRGVFSQKFGVACGM